MKVDDQFENIYLQTATLIRLVNQKEALSALPTSEVSNILELVADQLDRMMELYEQTLGEEHGKTKHKLNIDSLSNADIATVYFFFHKEAELHYEAFRKATNNTIKKVMELTIPKSEQEAIQLGAMEKADRKDWLTHHLADNETINALLMLVDNVTQFKSELDKEIPVLPKKPERKQVIPEAVFNMGSPRFPHTRESENGAVKVLNTSDNLAELLAHYGYTLRTNLLTLERELFYYGQRASQTVEESRSLIISLASMAGLPKAAIDDHLDALAKVESYHPVKLTLDTSGEWDGIKRVDNVIACLNAKVPEMANSVVKKWLVGCVASLYEPRFKSKLVPILQGAQSYRKTAFVERMATILENSFLEGAELDPDKKDNIISCVKSWIVELGEMERTSKKEQGAHGLSTNNNYANNTHKPRLNNSKGTHIDIHGVNLSLSNTLSNDILVWRIPPY